MTPPVPSAAGRTLPAAAQPADATPLLLAEGIEKRFGPTRALAGANLRLVPGSVHALMGENGAGKSTLVKILVGALTADAGTLRLEGRPFAHASVREAIRDGIVPIYQHFTLFEHLSVYENLCAFELAAGRGWRSAREPLPRARARELLAAVGLDLDLDRPVSALALGERQLLEIARGLGARCRVLMLDEPTAALSPAEAARLFAVIEALRRQGTAILYISHKIDEVEALADYVSVLRDGRTVVDAAPRGTLSRREVVQAMLGGAFDAAAKPRGAPGATALEATALRVARGSPPTDLAVGAGEVVGLVGLAGSGVLELAAALAGGPAADGRLAIRGRPVSLNDRAAAVRAGVAFIPGDRHAEGLFPILSGLANTSASMLRRLSRAGFLRGRAESATFAPWIDRLSLSPGTLGLPASGYSGGNQQKLLLARALELPELSVLVALEPTRGVDIAARDVIHSSLAAAGRQGVAIVVASSDLEEIATLCHRVLVVRDGAIVAEVDGAIDVDRVTHALAEATR